jgi:DnaJ-class molecular chaperone
MTEKPKEIIILCVECDGKGYTEKGQCETCKGEGQIRYKD